MDTWRVGDAALQVSLSSFTSFLALSDDFSSIQNSSIPVNCYILVHFCPLAWIFLHPSMRVYILQICIYVFLVGWSLTVPKLYFLSGESPCLMSYDFHFPSDPSSILNKHPQKAI